MFDNKLRLFIVLATLFSDDMNDKIIDERFHLLEKFVTCTDMPTIDIVWAFNAYLQMKPDTTNDFALLLKKLFQHKWMDEEQFIEYCSTCRIEGALGFEKLKTVFASISQCF